MASITCPECNHEYEYDTCEYVFHGEDYVEEEQCPKCEKYFVFTSYVEIVITSRKAPCLNGADHKYKVTTTIPALYTKMRCDYCDNERVLTDEEFNKYVKPRLKCEI